VRGRHLSFVTGQEWLSTRYMWKMDGIIEESQGEL